MTENSSAPRPQSVYSPFVDTRYNLLISTSNAYTLANDDNDDDNNDNNKTQTGQFSEKLENSGRYLHTFHRYLTYKVTCIIFHYLPYPPLAQSD